MTSKMTASRLFAARRELYLASCAADVLPAAAALLEVAAVLGGAGGAGGADEAGVGGVGGEARARALLDELARYLRTAVTELPATGAPESDDDRKFALYLLAKAALLRDRDDGLVSDLDDAIGCLRRLRPEFAARTAERADIDAELGTALYTRASRLSDRIDDLDEAAALLESVLEGPTPEDRDAGSICALLALQRAIRYASYGGAEGDRDDALAYARACLTEPGTAAPSRVVAVGHMVTAWMLLVRQLTAAQRALTVSSAAVQAARTNRASAEALVRQMGSLQIAAADAETAITHLRQIPDEHDDPSVLGFAPLLWSVALLATVPTEEATFPAGLTADAARVASQLGMMPLSGEPGGLSPGELQAMQAALLAVQARGAGQAPAGTAASALADAVTGLPAGHLLRPSLLNELGQVIDRQVAEAGAADDVTSRLTRLLDDMERMPHDDPVFQRKLVAIGIHMLSLGGTNRDLLQADWLTARFERLAASLDPADPVQLVAQYLLSTSHLAHALAQHRLEAAKTIMDDLSRQVAAAPADYPARPYMLVGLAVAYLDRVSMGGELRYLRPARRVLDQAMAEAALDGPFGESGPYHSMLLFIRGHLGAVESFYEGNRERVVTAIADLERAQALLDAMGQEEPGRMIGSMIASSLRGARMLRDTTGTEGASSGHLAAGKGSDGGDFLEIAKRLGPRNPQYPRLLAQGAGELMMRAHEERDITLMDQAVRLLAEASNVGELSLYERSWLLELHGAALHTRYQVTRVPRDLSNAIDRLEEARRVVEQAVGSQHEASVLRSLSSAYRTRANTGRGDVNRAVCAGLAGLRKHAGDVFLQDGEENALHMARRGSGEATEMARWFLDHERGDAAVSALELGRGMVLHAATASAGVEQVLREAGQPELAGEWARSAGQPDSDPDVIGDLRHRVMLAVEQTPAHARLLSAPAISDIAAALTATGNDALAYLLPRDEEGPGLAVIVGADGTVRRLPLPGLYTGGGSLVTAFLRTRRAVEAAEAASEGSAESAARTAAARSDWLSVLGTLCGWAWRMVVRPLLGALSAPGADSEPRIVLVPAAELGMVPWHAAREPVTGRYACQLAEFSYAPSARQFIESSVRRPRPWTQAPVLISDASGSLYLTAVGLAYLHAAYYPAGAVFGYAHHRLDPTVPGGPDVSRDDVLGALPRAGMPGASLLHFGCHGRAQVPVLGSSLILGADASGTEVRVAVQDILARARTARSTGATPGEALGLVVLASCLTDATESDFDEMLTLATAFLAAGAVGVVAARWTVAAGATALFMNVFHQFLNMPGTRPARALRAAQLWMLDPNREVPGAWPQALREEVALADRLEGPGLASPQAWAGFSYQGW